MMVQHKLILMVLQIKSCKGYKVVQRPSLLSLSISPPCAAWPPQGFVRSWQYTAAGSAYRAPVSVLFVRWTGRPSGSSLRVGAEQILI